MPIISNLYNGHVQSDWNQNDPKQPDYVKNRTHYVGIETIVDETFVFQASSASTAIPYSVTPVVGEHYTVEFRGTSFDGVATEGTSGNQAYIKIADERGYNGVTWYPGTQMMSAFLAGGANGDIHYKVWKETIVPLPEEFIPDTIARIRDISDGTRIVDLNLEPIQDAECTSLFGSVENYKTLCTAIYDGEPIIIQNRGVICDVYCTVSAQTQQYDLTLSLISKAYPEQNFVEEVVMTAEFWLSDQDVFGSISMSQSKTPTADEDTLRGVYGDVQPNIFVSGGWLTSLDSVYKRMISSHDIDGNDATEVFGNSSNFAMFCYGVSAGMVNSILFYDTTEQNNSRIQVSTKLEVVSDESGAKSPTVTAYFSSHSSTIRRMFYIDPTDAKKILYSETTESIMPEMTQDDSGKIPAINADGTGFHLVNAPISLPAVTEADNGKTLRVVDGMWQVVDIGNASGGSY